MSSGPEVPQYEEDKKGISGKMMSAIEDSFLKKVDTISSLFDSERASIFLTHNVPFNTSLDKIRMK